MKRKHLRSAALIAATAALALSTLGAPAAANGTVPGKVVFVNGTAGRSLDFCVDGQELKSSLRYGNWAVRKIEPGSHLLKVRLSSRGVCKGRKVSKQRFELDPAGDLTFVTSWGIKKLLTFDNRSTLVRADVLPSPGIAAVSIGHAAMAPPVFMLNEREEIGPFGITVDSPYAFHKGDHFVGIFRAPFSFRVRAFNVRNDRQLGRVAKTLAREGRIYEHYLVGKQGKFRWVIVDRAFDALPD